MLKNKNILLRAPELQDVDFLFEIENDTSLWHLSNTLSPFSRFDLEQYILSADKDIFKTGQLRFIIESLEKGAVGIVDLFDFEPVHKRAGVGIMIKTEMQNQGFAGDALDLLIEYAQKKLALKQLYCNIESSNKNSIRLFEKFGFVESGLKKDWNYFEGKWVDELFLQNIFGTK